MSATAAQIAAQARTYGTARLIEKDGRRQWEIVAAPSVMLRLRRLFQGSSRSGAKIHVADTLEACRDLAWVCERWPLTIEPAGHAFDRARRHRDAESAVERILAAEYVPREVELALPPRDYQLRAAELALATRGLLLADDMGLGKTLSSICVLVDANVRPALVVTLTHLPKQWEAEFRKFAPDLRVHRIRDGGIYDLATWGSRKRRPAGQLEIAGAGARLPDVIITSYSKLTKWADVLAPIVRSVVWDEVQELRHADSQKYQAAKQIAEATDLRLGLSATPIYNFGGEIYSVLGAISPGTLGTWGEFAATWCGHESADRKKARISDPRQFGAWAREQGLMLRRTRSDVGRELPDVTRAVHHIEADPAALEEVAGRAAELAKIILAETQEKGAAMQASAELDWRLRQATGIAKAPFVAEMVRLLVESGEKVVVFAWHHAVYNVLAERLNDLGVVRFTGEESSTQKATALSKFLRGGDDPITNVLLMSLRAGAGVDGLQHACRTVVFAELDWSPAVHEQALGRVARDGQTQPVVAYYLVSDSGSDPIVSDVLGVKAVQVEGLRDPDAEVLGAPQMDPHHVRKLAEAYLARSKETA